LLPIPAEPYRQASGKFRCRSPRQPFPTLSSLVIPHPITTPASSRNRDGAVCASTESAMQSTRSPETVLPQATGLTDCRPHKKQPKNKERGLRRLEPQKSAVN